MTPRDIITQAITEWYAIEEAKWVGMFDHDRMLADAVLAALAAAGLVVVDRKKLIEYIDRNEV